MIIGISKENLAALLGAQVQAWRSVGGGANPDAYAFDPTTTPPSELKQLGFYDNRDAWVAGVQIKVLEGYIESLDDLPAVIV